MSICVICNVYFEKGISICCSRQCHNKRINKRDRSNDKNVLEAKEREHQYNLTPAICQNSKCINSISYESHKHGAIYCSHSCSAIVSHEGRTTESRKQQSETLLDTMRKLNRNRSVTGPYSRVKFINCQNQECKKLFAFHGIGKRPYCSIECLGTKNIKSYRRACSFKISNTKHPQLFNIPLLTKCGWYRASNHPNGYNPDGATWDHLFRVEDGFKLGIPPEIMSHPANAEMISWRDNILRRKSIISYEELLEKIDNFK